MTPVPDEAPVVVFGVLTIDELRALSRRFGTTLPAILLDDEDGGDDDGIDRAALRGLAARGLVEGPVDELIPVPALFAVLDALDAATTMVELDRDPVAPTAHTAASGRVAMVAGASGGALAFEQFEAGLWLAAWFGDLPAAMEAFLGDVLPAPATIEPVVAIAPSVRIGSGFDCPAPAHAAADEALLDGRPDEAHRILVGAGVEADMAARWIEAIEDRRCAFAVEVATAAGAGGWDVATVRAVVGPDGSCWRIEAVADLDRELSAEGPSPDDLDGLRSVVEVVAPAALRSAVLGLAVVATMAGGVGR